jgi:amino acid transporter
MAQVGDSGLVRSIRKWDLAAVTINAVIGAGIFGLPSKIYALAGIYSVPASLLCGIFTGMIVMCFAEVGSRFTGSGGPYLYIREAFGNAAGFTTGWLIWIARITAFAANTTIMLSYLSLFWPAVAAGLVRIAAVCAVTLALMTINIVGVRDVAIATDIITVAKLAPLALLIVAGSFQIDPQKLSAATIPDPVSFASAMLLLVYAYTGFEIAVIPAAEIRDPRRDLPQAILTAIGVVAIFYVLIQIVCIGTLPDLAASDRPIADAARRVLGSRGGATIAAAVVISIAGNLNVVMLSASRLPFAMASRGELPRVLAGVHQRFRTPRASILVTGAAMAALTLSGTFLYAVTLSTVARLLIYAATCAALPVLRKRAGPSHAGFRVPAGRLVAYTLVLLIAWLLLNTTWREARDLGIAVAAGLAVYAARRGRRAATAVDAGASTVENRRP